MSVTSIKNLSSWMVLAYDSTCVVVAWSIANFLLAGPAAVLSEPHLVADAIILFLAQLVSYRHFRTYRPIWKFTTFSDIHRLLKASLIGSAAGFILIFLVNQFAYSPMLLFPLYGLGLLSLLCIGRLASRYWMERSRHSGDMRKVLLIGAGRAAELFIRETQRASVTQYTIQGLLDDDPRLLGKEISNKRVLGKINELAKTVESVEVDELVIAMPSIQGKRLRGVIKRCESTQKPIKILPSLLDVASGKVNISQLRDVSIEDLLRRDEIKLDDAELGSFILGKTVLVTGGGGSIGSEILRQLLAYKPSQLVIVDNSEYNLYLVDQELNAREHSTHIVSCLVDVKNRQDLQGIFNHYRPDIVYHAAAYKHVPLLEKQQEIAFDNNVTGTINTVKAADSVGVKKFILISTDKAVNPSSVMGATKRIAEIFCQQFNKKSETDFCAVRFGNVLGSRGSVIPLFKKQIEKGGPVTVTHPDIERYFMTIPEACQLVLQASRIGEGGDIFVLDMGEPVKIVYLAEQLIRLSGKTPYDDIDIVFTGLRDGEKLFEELSYSSEFFESAGLKSINRVTHSNTELPRGFGLETYIDNMKITEYQ